MNKFLQELVSEISDKQDKFVELSFDENNLKYGSSIFQFKANRLIISLSNNFFEKNLDALRGLENPNFLKAIISLPIFNEDDNLILLIFDASKSDDEFILIDKTDCLIQWDDDNWQYLKNDIISIYNDFRESQDSIIVKVDEIIDSPKPALFSDNAELDNNADSPFLKLNVKKEETPSKYKVLSNDLADDLLNLKEERSTREEISKHDTVSIENNRPEVSFSKLNELFYLKRRQNPENLLYKNEKPILDEKVNFLRLFYLTDIQAITEKNNKDSILIKTDKESSDKLIYYNLEIDEFEDDDIFIEISNFHYDLSKEFLYCYLSSNSGMDDIIYFSRSKRYIRPDDIKEIKIPLPSLDTQKKIVRTIKESREFFHDVELLKKEFQSNILDYKHIDASLSELRGDIEFDKTGSVIEGMSRSRIHAYKGMIWPLAISYLYATKGNYEVVGRLDNYLTLFEFVAAFNAVVLISSLPEDVYEENFKDIWNLNIDAYKKEMSYGNWVHICKNIGEVYRKNSIQTTTDKKLIDAITSKKIIDILFKALRYRNDKHHGSLMNPNEAKTILEELEVYLEEIYDILDIYSDYKLIYATSKADIKDNSQRVILLNGPCAQPIYETMFFDKLLTPERLYLYKNNKKLLIKNSLMKFIPTDEFEKHWAILIYNSCDKYGNYAKYKCFQSKEYEHEEEIFDFEYDILKGE